MRTCFLRFSFCILVVRFKNVFHIKFHIFFLINQEGGEFFVFKGETTWKRGEPQPNGCRDVWAAVLFVAQLLAMIKTELTIGIWAMKEFRDVESAEAAADGASAADADFSGVVGTFCIALYELHAFAPFSRSLLTLSHHRTSPLARRPSPWLPPSTLYSSRKGCGGNCLTPPPGRQDAVVEMPSTRGGQTTPSLLPDIA